MILDRNGNYIRVGWSEVEDIYCIAAASLSQKDRVEAYQDIADMTGRKYAAIQRRGEGLLAEKRRKERAEAQKVLSGLPKPSRPPTIPLLIQAAE